MRSSVKLVLGLLGWMWGLLLWASADQIAVFYALDADAAALSVRGANLGPPVQIGSRSVRRLRLGAHTVYAVKMGSGCLETALSAQALLTRFRCDRAFSVGPAGGLDDRLPVGSWHRVAGVTAWQADNDPAYALPPVTNLPPVTTLLNTTSRITVASGEQFIADPYTRARIRETRRAEAVDMNMLGLVRACADHQVPLVAWKIISDHATETATEDFRLFRSAYDGAGGEALGDLILALPPDPADPLTHPAIERALQAD